MRRKWLKFSAYPAAVIFMAAGLCATTLAWHTASLVHDAMANSSFLFDYGLMGFMDGGALQLLQILWHGVIALLAFFGFKACETDLMRRWRAWQERL